jgi:hypothetical protein
MRKRLNFQEHEFSLARDIILNTHTRACTYIHERVNKKSLKALAMHKSRTCVYNYIRARHTRAI